MSTLLLVFILLYTTTLRMCYRIVMGVMCYVASSLFVDCHTVRYAFFFVCVDCDCPWLTTSTVYFFACLTNRAPPVCCVLQRYRCYFFDKMKNVPTLFMLDQRHSTSSHSAVHRSKSRRLCRCYCCLCVFAYMFRDTHPPTHWFDIV